MFQLKWLGPVVVLVALIGCSKPEDKYVGHFNGKLTLDPDTRAKLLQSGGTQATQFVQAMEGANFSLDLKKDMTFSMKISGARGSRNSGSWTFAAGVITLGDPKSNHPTKLTPNEDGNTLTLTNQSDGKSVVTFTKGEAIDPSVQ